MHSVVTILGLTALLAQADSEEADAVAPPPLPKLELPEKTEDGYPNWPVELQTEVMKIARTFDGEIHLFVKDVNSGARYSFNGATRAYIASGVKVLFMVELFRQVEAGVLTLDDEMEYEPDDIRDGAPVLNYVPVGAKLPIRVLLDAMIHQSDNVASDMIARRVGIQNVNLGLSALGFDGFGPITSLLDVRRRVWSFVDPRARELTAKHIREIGFAKSTDARMVRLAQSLGAPPGSFSAADAERAYRRYYASGVNTATMESFGALLEGMVLGQVVSSTASAQMLALLSGTQTGGRRITAYLPPSTRVAHKTGTQYRRTCDLGILYVADNQPVVFAACMKGSTTPRREEVIARIAAHTFDLLAPRGPGLARARLKTKPMSSKKRGGDSEELEIP